MPDMSEGFTLTTVEIAVLNAARDVLHEKTKGYPDDYGWARCIYTAEHAEHAVFEFLNVANSWAHIPMTPEQLHRYSVRNPEPTPYDQAAQTCRDCGTPFPYSEDADRCADCTKEAEGFSVRVP